VSVFSANGDKKQSEVLGGKLEVTFLIFTHFPPELWRRE
jgi:hypothetical protein